MIAIQSHDCSGCKLHKRKIEISEIDQDDIKVYARIQTQLNNTQQAADPSSLENLPDTISKENKEIYMKAALENYEKAKALLVEWWQEMIRKYNIPMSSKFDADEGAFYECVDADGNPDMSGQFIPKE